MTLDGFRRLALSLPEAEEEEHRGRPSFRVRKKIFATLWPDDGDAVLKLPIVTQTAVVSGRPETFSTGPWAHQGWTRVRLAGVKRAELQDLLRQAWSGVAPKRLQ